MLKGSKRFLIKSLFLMILLVFLAIKIREAKTVFLGFAGGLQRVYMEKLRQPFQLF